MSQANAQNSNPGYVPPDTVNWQPNEKVPQISTKVTSEEIQTVNGTVDLEVTFNVPDSVIIKPQVEVYSKKPSAGNFFSLSQTPLDSTIDADTFTTNFTFSYDQTDLPYYDKGLVIEGKYHKPGDTSMEKSFAINARLYFTPYNTLEVWNMQDFHKLKRAWLNPQEGSTKQRQYIHPDSIPESNIPDDTAEIDHDWQKEWDYVFIDGLAYAIPMKKDEEPTCINEDACSQSKNKKGDGCFLSKRYKYRLQGSISEELRNDLNQPFDLPYSNLQIKFYENDATKNTYTNIDDQYLGKTTLDEDGNFDFKFNICQVGEQGEIEVYIVVRAYNPKWKIRGRTLKTDLKRGNAPMLVNRAISEQITLPESDDRTVENGINLDIESGLHSSVVYASHAMNFAENNLNLSHNDLQKPINIMLTPLNFGNFFYPSSLLSGALPTWPFKINFITGQSYIFLDENNLGTENTTYHEMGHYMMWKLQDQNWIDPLTASFADWGRNEENNPRITWTEGWADAFAYICDLRYFNIDQECHRYEDINYEEKVFNTGRGQAPLNNFTHGFLHPVSVAAAIYDLYDGQQTYNTHNIPPAQFAFDDNNSPSWNNNNMGQDNVELTFQEICQPIIDNAGLSGKLHDIDDYFRELMRNANCGERRDIKRVFDANEVVNDRNNPGETGLSTDMIGENVTHDVNVLNVEIFNTEVDWDYVEDFYIDGQANDPVTFHAGVLNTGNIARYSGLLIDDLVLQNNEFLRVNNHNLQVGNSPFDFVRNTGFSLFTPPLNSHYILNLCQGMQIEASDGGSIRIGTENNGNSSASVYLQEGGQITLGGNGNPNDQNLVINKGSRLIIERGATLIYREDANIKLNQGSELVIRGELQIGQDATFSINGNGSGGIGRVIFDGPDDERTIKFAKDNSSSLKIKGHRYSSPPFIKDTIVEIREESIQSTGSQSIMPPYSNKNHAPDEFSMSDGIVLMGEGSRIDAKGPLKLLDIHMLPLNPGVKHDGVKVYGQSNVSFNGSHIKGATTGIYVYNWFYVFGKINNDIFSVDVTNCETGIEAYQGNIDLYKVFLKNNHVGFKANNNNTAFSVKASNIKENSEAGITMNGARTSQVTLKNDEITNNRKGVQAFNVGVNGYCSDISSNENGGISISNNFVHLSRTMKKESGYVDLSQNGPYGLKVKNPKLELQEGYNNFRGESMGCNRGYLFFSFHRE